MFARGWGLIERLADATGLPVGIKSAVGDPSFCHDLARAMDTTGRGPDFITIDGGEWLYSGGEFSKLDKLPNEAWDMLRAMTQKGSKG